MQDLKITVVQVDQFWEDISANLKLYADIIVQLEQTDLILLPEMFHTAFSMNVTLAEEWIDNKAVEQLKRWSGQTNAAIYTSMMVCDTGGYFNRGVFVFPNGNVEIYDKRKSFGLGGEDKVFTQGKKETIVSFKGWKINLQICYDLRFPELCRNGMDDQGQAAYDLLLYVANWPEKRVLHWSSLLQARAIENQCYVIGANRVGTDGNKLVYPGASVVYDGLGTARMLLDNQPSVGTCNLDYTELLSVRTTLPFLKDKK